MMAKLAVMVSCPHCDGRGRVELTGVYADTFRLLQIRRGMNATALASIAGCKDTAMANRLRALERMGLALCRKNGRENLWTAKRI
jgi:hypothetical protein